MTIPLPSDFAGSSSGSDFRPPLARPGDFYGALNIVGVAQLASATRKRERDANGYRLFATIPWKELGLTAPKSGSFLQGDVGVLQSDGSGTQTSLRRYFYNQDTAIVNDVPTEVRVNTSDWGKLYFE